jgi:hypothetical protein
MLKWLEISASDLVLMIITSLGLAGLGLLAFYSI